MKKSNFLILVTILFFLQIIHISCIVDRTFFNYMGLKITATQQDIQKAYQQKKVKVQSIEDDEERTKKLKVLQSAYKTLSNDQQREKYQRYGKDVFKTINQITSINQYNGADSRKGPTMKMKIPVSIQELYNGTTVQAQFQAKQACPKCMGTGAHSPKEMKKCNGCAGRGFTLMDGFNRFGQPQQFQGVCPQCQGSGKQVLKSCDHCHGKRLIDTLKHIQINIPGGYKQKEFKLKNYGSQQQLGAPSDFQVQIEQIPSQKWRRNGDNLIYTMQISLEDSIFGFSKNIRHLSGQQVLVQRSDITTKQTKVHFAGKGLNQRGKLTIQFKIIIPNFTDRQLDMWEDFFNRHKL